MFLPPNHQPDIAPVSNDQGQFNKKYPNKFSTNLLKVSVLGLAFCSGVTIAHLCRLIPNSSTLYFIGIGMSIGWLMLVQPEQKSIRTQSLRRLAGLGFGVSLTAWWDAIIQIASLPVAWFGIVLPIGWIVILCLGAIGLLLLYSFTARHTGSRGGIR
jgi:hypothetical protein